MVWSKTVYDMVPHIGMLHLGRIRASSRPWRSYSTWNLRAPRAAVLELGCTDGGNLIPMALDCPQRVFGIDLSALRKWRLGSR